MSDQTMLLVSKTNGSKLFSLPSTNHNNYIIHTSALSLMLGGLTCLVHQAGSNQHPYPPFLWDVGWELQQEVCLTWYTSIILAVLVLFLTMAVLHTQLFWATVTSDI
jgi:hypothetical protein